jgi:arabinofuranosyltransferase
MRVEADPQPPRHTTAQQTPAASPPSADRRTAYLRAALLLALLAATVLGACALWFLCDDAYITFRYVANARDGHGLVWNPPPFQPVEGYTGFLWALVLWATWSLFGVEPPDAANVWSILCGLAQLAVLAVAVFRIRGRDGARVSDTIAFVTLACLVGNRTFLQWMTGGLETALFNLAFLSWVVLAFRSPETRSARWLATWSCAAAVAALTRPDGLLLVAATVAAALAQTVTRGGVTRVAIGLSPLAAVLAHVAWRRSFYGEWVPNTWYAKVVAAWPEAGTRYFVCFLVEHGLWLWFPIALVWATVRLVRHRGNLAVAAWRHLPACAAVATVACHAGYYVLAVGGDHFEYRVLSQLVPLAWLGLAAMLAQLARRQTTILAGLLAMFVFSAAGWAHLWLNRHTTTHDFNPISAGMPSFLQPLGRWYDRQQGWLHMHFVCLRCQQHAMVLRGFAAKLPERRDHALPDGDVPVKAEVAVGLAGWVLKDCAIIDLLGLNDWVVARSPAVTIAPDSPFTEANLLRNFAAANGNHDDWLDRAELNVWAALTVPGAHDQKPIVDRLLALFAARSDSLSMAEARVAATAFQRGHIAHERAPPPGYVEAFEPNVTVTPEGVTVAPRAVPLRPRIASIEAEWRDKVRRGELARVR